jgi:glyoxylase-like metal-dependent hydrolase (beta-lactamase superfamily II)
MFTGGQDGHLIEELQSVGVRPEDIDTVFFTHLHPDHVGWNLTQGGGDARATFPQARYGCFRTTPRRGTFQRMN